MSMVNDFKAKLPIKANDLIETMILVLGELDVLKTKVFDFDVALQLANNTSAGTNITSIINQSTFNELFDSIQSGYSLKMINTNAVVNVLSANVSEIPGDNYKSITLTYCYGTKIISLSMSTFGSGIYLDDKSIKSL